jgi:adenine-specific DNA-methyltransferase
MFESGKVRTELTWTGKKKKIGMLPQLPFQTVEIVNETRKRSLDTYTISRPTDEHNQLIWGDNKFIMNSLLKDFEEKINLIYIDPPFATGADFKMPIKVNGDR